MAAAAMVGSAVLLAAAIAFAGVLHSPAVHRSRARGLWLACASILAVVFSLPPVLALVATDRARAVVAGLGVLTILIVLCAVTLRLWRLRQQPAAHDENHVWDVGPLIAETNDVILIVDHENRIRFASPSARGLLGTAALHDRYLVDLIVPTERRTALYLLRHARQGLSDDVARADWTVLTVDGATAQVEVSCRNVQTGSARELIVTMRDVTVQRNLEYELTRRMFHDPVTGLPNGLLFADRVNQAVADDEGIAAVLVIDLDRFRSINEVFGREEGDAVLAAVGARIGDAAGAESVTARLGGDEFAVLAAHLDSLAAAEAMTEQICRLMAEPLPGRSDGLICTASVGLATTLLADNGQQLIRNAEQALDSAKAVGSGHWRRFDPTMTTAIRHRMEIRSALRQALEEDELVVHYQPIVDLHNGRTVGLEALVRWRHPTRGLLAPAEFIEIAEESGLITAIGDRVLQVALRTAQTWVPVMPGAAPYVSVNVSARQFRSIGFLDLLDRRRAETGMAADRVVIEITESLLLRDDDEVWEDLRRVRQQGIRIAIDDFGTGYSALGYLRQVPLDIVKLDRVFMTSMEASRRQRELVHGIVRLTNALDLKVVAEGIETERQREIAAEVGCEYGQGYVFSRPMSDVDAMAWLKQGRG